MDSKHTTIRIQHKKMAIEHNNCRTKIRTFFFLMLRKRNIFLLVFATILYICLRMYYTENSDKVGKVNCLNDTQREELANLTLTVAEALDHLNQTYWLDYGCLLGVARMGRILPHDYDCDFGRLVTKKIPNFHQKFEDFLRNRGRITKYTPQELENGKIIVKRGYYQVDIFSFLPEKDGRKMSVAFDTKWDSEATRAHYVGNYFWQSFIPIRYFVPTQKIKFHNSTINVPGKIWPALRQTYPFSFWYTIKKLCDAPRT